MKQPKLIVVGAGPGDPELITIKAVNALKNADAVLYDALVNKALLEYTPTNVPKVFVGKRKGKHTFTQDQINELIVEYAQKYGTVIRLKGGDPFVFGRGYEEMEFARKHQLTAEYIPGVTSAISIPGLQGIPVTFRGSSESFWVITGTTSNRQLSDDIHLAVNSTATIVVLMGLTKLPGIVDIYIKNNKSDKPIAIIQKGASDGEKMIKGTMATILKKYEEHKMSPPAIIVIGDVINSV